MLTETVQQANHVLSLPIAPPPHKTAGIAPKNEQLSIMPERANTVICPDTGKSLKHQLIIRIL
jgi:hypothetical protein